MKKLEKTSGREIQRKDITAGKLLSLIVIYLTVETGVKLRLPGPPLPLVRAEEVGLPEGAGRQ